ncbi:MAG: S-methyl-5'-thioinosine phosphorylase [Gammaproteobacteria bacterium]|nr:S-methyl-5'-thioinosine phosphorylase [Gammaproteobacteria bacterium]
MLAIIGGTGLTDYKGLEIIESKMISTPYGYPSSELTLAKLYGKSLIFFARHGKEHTVPPHKVNYRANIWALKSEGVESIVAVNAVGGLHPDFSPGSIVLPDQIIDYTYDRLHTYFDENIHSVTHIDFTYPYTKSVIDKLSQAALNADISIYQHGTYGCTQGPRLETAAEINRLIKDGCDLVGMTAMPEAALARELELEYASINIVANWGAGLSDDVITMNDIEKVVSHAIDKVKTIIGEFVKL